MASTPYGMHLQVNLQLYEHLNHTIAQPDDLFEIYVWIWMDGLRQSGSFCELETVLHPHKPESMSMKSMKSRRLPTAFSSKSFHSSFFWNIEENKLARLQKSSEGNFLSILDATPTLWFLRFVFVTFFELLNGQRSNRYHTPTMYFSEYVSSVLSCDSLFCYAECNCRYCVS